MKNQPKTERGDYDYKKDQALKKVAQVFEDCLGHFHGEEENRIREDIANYTIGYLGVVFGPHVKR
jgi:hypothetical protein